MVETGGDSLRRLRELQNGGPRILPSILSADFANLAGSIAPLEAAGAQVLHLDVMDGHFVPNITFGPPLVRSIRKHTRAYLDVHLMITDPIAYLEPFAKAGADLCTFHAETGVDPGEVVGEARRLGLALGVSLRPSTDLEPVLERWARHADLILVMSVEPGFGGQEFHPEAPERLRGVRRYCASAGVDPVLEVDGGIGPENAAEVTRAGALWLVSGSSVFRTEDPVRAWREMSEAARAGAR